MLDRAMVRLMYPAEWNVAYNRILIAAGNHIGTVSFLVARMQLAENEEFFWHFHFYEWFL
jgi:hypothetical protein